METVKGQLPKQNMIPIQRIKIKPTIKAPREEKTREKAKTAQAADRISLKTEMEPAVRQMIQMAERL